MHASSPHQCRATSVLILFFLNLVTGCATLTKDECLYGDWRTIGYDDGAAGQPPARISEHQKSCVEYGITPDFTLYHQGYAQGVKLFCTRQNGYDKGVAGYSYTGICPPELENDFLAGYRPGRELHQLRQEHNELANDLERIERSLSTVSQKLREKKQLLFKDDTSKGQRRDIYRDMEHLKDERYDLELRRGIIEQELREVDIRLHRLERKAYD